MRGAGSERWSRTDLDIPETELVARRAAWQKPPVDGTDRGYLRLSTERVMGADTGTDFDFLVGSSGHAVPRQAF